MTHNESERRVYWASQLDDAHAFMMRIMDYPVEECGERLVSLPDVAEKANAEVLFSDRPHVNDLPRIYMLREGQITGFIEAAQRLNSRGWVMRIEDGYRSRTMQKGLGLADYVFDVVFRKVIWELDGQTPEPDFLFKRLLGLVAQIPKVGTHMSGSAIDVSVLDRDTGEEIDRGKPYLELSELTPMNSPFISQEAMRNRQKITAIFRESGFVEYPYEFWHYSSGDAYDQLLRDTGKPARYGAVNFNQTTGQMTPIENPHEHLNSLAEIQAKIRASLKRLSKKPFCH